MEEQDERLEQTGRRAKEVFDASVEELGAFLFRPSAQSRDRVLEQLGLLSLIHI